MKIVNSTLKHQRSSSWTQQETARLKCPKRFFFRYLDPEKAGAPYQHLLSVRELGGCIIHEALAGIVARVADGGRVSDEEGVAAEAQRQFLEIVARSLATAPGELCGGRQLAETFNSAVSEEDILHWRDYIPECIENGRRVMIGLNIRSNSDGYSVEAEKRISYTHNGKDHRGIMDVYILDGKNRIIIDWKTHGITSTDLRQLDHYIRFIERTEKIPSSRITGFAVDLARELTIPRKLELSGAFIGARASYGKGKTQNSSCEKTDPYPSEPSLVACGICPFTMICKDAVIQRSSSETEVSL